MQNRCDVTHSNVTTDELARYTRIPCVCTQGCKKRNVYSTYRLCSTLTEFRVYYVMRLRAYMFVIFAMYYLYRLWSRYLYKRASPVGQYTQIQSTVIGIMSAQIQDLISHTKLVLMAQSSTYTIKRVKKVISASWWNLKGKKTAFALLILDFTAIPIHRLHTARMA
jgi:hypothetical protein